MGSDIGCPIGVNTPCLIMLILIHICRYINIFYTIATPLLPCACATNG